MPLLIAHRRPAAFDGVGAQMPMKMLDNKPKAIENLNCKRLCQESGKASSEYQKVSYLAKIDMYECIIRRRHGFLREKNKCIWRRSLFLAGHIQRESRECRRRATVI